MKIDLAIFNTKQAQDFLSLLENEIVLQDRREKITIKYKQLRGVFGDNEKIKKLLSDFEGVGIIKLDHVYQSRFRITADHPDFSEIMPDGYLITCEDFYAVRRYTMYKFKPDDEFVFEYDEKKIQKFALQKIHQEKDVINKKLINKDNNGDFYYAYKLIEMSHNTLHYGVLDALYSMGDPFGFLSFKKIASHIRELGTPINEDDAKAKSSIQHALTNGLFKIARVNGKVLQNKIPSGKKLIEPVRGKGLKLNNPQM